MKATVCIGASASGKSTWADQFTRIHNDWFELNRDNIRFNHFCNGVRDWSVYEFKWEKRVTEIFNQELDLCVSNQKNVIVSDTNLNPKYRDILIKKLEEYGYEVEIKEFEEDLEELYRRDKLRPNSVGHDVIYKQWLQWLEYKGHKKYEPDVTLEDCIVVDVDGTVASMEGVRGPFEWHKVFDDKPISTVMDIVNGLHKMGYSVVFLSGRDGVCYEDTKAWLEKYFKFPIELYMRAESDMRKDHVIKRELFFNHVADEYNVRMVLDDRVQVIEQCWTPLGLKVINCGRINDRF